MIYSPFRDVLSIRMDDALLPERVAQGEGETSPGTCGAASNSDLIDGAP